MALALTQDRAVSYSGTPGPDQHSETACDTRVWSTVACVSPGCSDGWMSFRRLWTEASQPSVVLSPWYLARLRVPCALGVLVTCLL